MPRLASPTDRLQNHYEVVVIGSGYGGGIAASRLARAGRQVCLLERGKEFQAGQYPRSKLEMLAELQADFPLGALGHFGPETGLYDFRVNPDINVFLGCGLGGTSLINSGVMVPADRRVFDDPRWPEPLRDPAALAPYVQRAEAMLRPVPYPSDYPPLAKLAALARATEPLGAEVQRPPIHTNFTRHPDGRNHVGVAQAPCVNCGDCETGCNYDAKNNVLMTYLPDARRHGAEIFTEIAVRSLARSGDRWHLHCRRLDAAAEERVLTLSADTVVLAAGTLGSTEILLRARDGGLALPDGLGHGFSGNGDQLGLIYNGEQPVNAVGVGPRALDPNNPAGPAIAGMVDFRDGQDLEDGLVLQVGGLPGALAPLLPGVFAAAAKLTGVGGGGGFRGRARRKLRAWQSLLAGSRGAYLGAVQRTQICLVVTHDDGAGRMVLEKDRLRIHWPDVGRQAGFQRASDLLERAAAGTGGVYVPNLGWNELTHYNLLTGHPLGGCAMGSDGQSAVVDDRCQVFTGQPGGARHPGLYVMDAAVVPRSLGANPALTICALAERAVDALAKDRGWQLDTDLSSS